MFVVLFHVFYLLGKLVLRRYARRGRLAEPQAICRHHDDEDDDNDQENLPYVDVGASCAEPQAICRHQDDDDDNDQEDLPYVDVGTSCAEPQALCWHHDDDDDDDNDLPYVDVGACCSKAMKDRTNHQQRASGEETRDGGDRVPIKFHPPAYLQRYTAVIETLKNSNSRGTIKKVVDFGCAELKMCVYLKTMASVEEILFVDVDRPTLDVYEVKARPLHVDYLHRRDKPLIIRVMEGSVTDNDKSLENCDAVICIELVEHLYPEPFTMMPFNIFGYIKPKVAIITTPNADFNVLFGDMKGFRHPDHKFEWTRKQFEDWAHNIVSRFPEYEVKFQGICDGPPETEHLGACTQMAIFHKIYDLKTEKEPGIEGLFKTVNTYEYPYEVDNRSDEEKILDDAVYFINKFSANAEDLSEEIPLQKIVEAMTNFYISVNDLKEILENANWTVVDHEDGPAVLVPPDSYSDRSLIEEDFLDHDLAHDEWDEDPGPPNEYFERGLNVDVNVVDEENWDSEPRIIESGSENQNVDDGSVVDEEGWVSEPRIIVSESENQNVDNVNIVHEEGWGSEQRINVGVNIVDEEDWSNEPPIIESESESHEEETASPDAEVAAANSTASIYPNDICLDDIATESRSTEFANSEVDGSSILISSYSETKDSENSENGKESSSLEETASTCTDNKATDITATFFSHVEEENKSKNSMSRSGDLTINKDSSMCSIFLEPSQISNDEPLKELSFLESTITSPTEKKTNKKLKLNNSTSLNQLNENTFDEPQYASSPYILSSVVSKKRKIFEGTEQSNTSSANSSNENLILYRSESSKDLLKRSNDSSSCSNESVIAESNLSDCSPTTSSESPEKLRHYTGTIPKNFNLKLSVIKVHGEETKLDSTTPDTPVSPLNSWSPEIMDSGYPNSNSPPDLSPEYDLSSIVYNHSDSESPSMADVPRGLPELPAENRDLANNNLDDEGNYMGPEENRQMHDLHPLINVLENDIENENDIFLMRDGFPVWLLRILQRLPLPDENFGE